MLGFLGIPAQVLLGGITVLTGLNPWTVAAHFLVSMALVAIATTGSAAASGGHPTPRCPEYP